MHEIVPVQTGVDRKTKEPIIFSKDEGPRAGTTAESLSKLKCCSGKEGGVVTAGNASGINDGAAAIVVMSEEKAKELGVTPMATFIGRCIWAVLIQLSWVLDRLHLQEQAFEENRSYN